LSEGRDGARADVLDLLDVGDDLVGIDAASFSIASFSIMIAS